MYDYTICPDANRTLFYKQCERIEQKIPGLKKEKLLVTFDDTLIQVYVLPTGKITVKNDELTGALYVLSDIDLKARGALVSTR